MFHVKHSTRPSPVDPDEIAARLSAIGVGTTPDQSRRLALHADMVLEANSRMNLTRITSAEAVISLHIVDSLAFLRHTGDLTGQCVDIGSGAGFPGIPLAVMGCNVRLCESVLKKAAFLQGCVEALGLEATVAAVRAEALAESMPACADVVIARAVSALASLVELAAPLLTSGGRLVALKGTPTASELETAEAAATLCGMRCALKKAYSLPTGERRTVIVYERTGAPRVRLPRRSGMAQRHPLGNE